MKNKQLNQYSSEGMPIGYWEDYWYNGNLYLKGNFNDNGIKVGYWEFYNFNGELYFKKYYV